MPYYNVLLEEITLDDAQTCYGCGQKADDWKKGPWIEGKERTVTCACVRCCDQWDYYETKVQSC